VKRSMARPKPTVLIDTNVLISGLVFLRGNEHSILKLAEDKAITLLLPQLVIEDARIVFARRFPSHEALLAAFLSRAEHAVLPWKEIEESVSLHENKVEIRRMHLCWPRSSSRDRISRSQETLPSERT